eukprot:scaffold981_cov119-Cylindrotheca_fusiformis.AAC.9
MVFRNRRGHADSSSSISKLPQAVATQQKEQNEPQFFVHPAVRPRTKKLRRIFQKKRRQPKVAVPEESALNHNSSGTALWDPEEIELVLGAETREEEFIDSRASQDSFSRESYSYEELGSKYTRATYEELGSKYTKATEDSTIYNLIAGDLGNDDFSMDTRMFAQDESNCDRSQSATRQVAASHAAISPVANKNIGIKMNHVDSLSSQFNTPAAVNDSSQGSADTRNVLRNMDKYCTEAETNASWNLKREIAEKQASHRHSSRYAGGPADSNSEASTTRRRDSKSSHKKNLENSTTQSVYTLDSTVLDDNTTFTDGESSMGTSTGFTTMNGESIWSEGASTFTDTTFDDSEIYRWKHLNSFDSWLSIQNELKGNSQGSCLFCGAW